MAILGFAASDGDGTGCPIPVWRSTGGASNVSEIGAHCRNLDNGSVAGTAQVTPAGYAVRVMNLEPDLDG
jgi:hypothetical protein